MSHQPLRGLARTTLACTMAVWLGVPFQATADDPLEDRDGTEGWDQVVDPQPRRDRDLEAERDAFKNEVADWESIRQLWQIEREGYIREKTAHKTYHLKWKRRRRSKQPSPPRSTERQTEADWGDESGQQWFESTTSSAVDEELGESGAVGGGPAKPLQPPESMPADTGTDPSLSPFRQSGGSAPSSAEQQRSAEEAARQEAARRRKEQQRLEQQEEERRRQAEEERRRREEEERRRQAEEQRRREEAEAAAGAAAAAELLRQQEEQMRKEQEALRKKADLETDEDGQVIDPDLAREIEEEE